MIIISPQLLFFLPQFFYCLMMNIFWFFFYSLANSNKRQASSSRTLTRCCIAFLSRKFDSTSSPPFFFSSYVWGSFFSFFQWMGIAFEISSSYLLSILVYLISWPQLCRKEMLLQFTPLLLDMLFECLNWETFYGCGARNLAYHG